MNVDVYIRAVNRCILTEGYGIMKPLPDGVASEIYEMWYFPLHHGCDLEMTLNLLTYFHSRENYWFRATTDGHRRYTTVVSSIHIYF